VAGVIGAVVFDVGECLVDETREYGTWADWLGVPRHVFSAVFGAVIARGQDYRETFQVFQPGFDLAMNSGSRSCCCRDRLLIRKLVSYWARGSARRSVSGAGFAGWRVRRLVRG
jgi:hypothetical protein